MSDDEPSFESSPPNEDKNVDASSDDESENVKPVNPIPAGDTTRMVRSSLLTVMPIVCVSLT